MNYKYLGERIRKQRQEKGMTQEDLAYETEVSAAFIGQIERSDSIPSLETVVKICNALDVSLDSLVLDKLHGTNSTNQFFNEIESLIKDFDANDKEFLLKVIHNLAMYKENLKTNAEKY